MKHWTIACVGIIAAAFLAVGVTAQPADSAEGRRQGRRGQGQARQHKRPPNPLMKALDTDKDGELSADEIENAPAALKTLDKDGDGKLSRQELRPPKAGPEDFVERLMRHDKNGDGKVTKDELPEKMHRLLERGDTNGDGAIDKAEAEAMAEKMKNRGERGERKSRGEKREKKSRRSDNQ